MRTRADILEALEESKLQSFHWKTMFTSGMGFFTDAYDLFIIGVVTTILAPIWHLGKAEIGILNATSLIAAALGAIIFGKLADRFGRKSVYGIEVIILTIGALLSATSQNFDQLLFWRFIIGLGIGGDYPTSAIIMSEYANRKNRGRLVTSVFAMQGFGLLVGPLVASGLLVSGLSHDLVWRLMLALGAIPAAAVIYLRRTISETPRYLLEVKRDQEEAAKVVSSLTQRDVSASEDNRGDGWTRSQFWLRVLGTAGSWFFLDIAFYGNSVSSTLIMKSLVSHASLLHTTLVSTLIFLIFAIPGYWVTAFTIDRLGRKTIQMLGFIMMALSFAGLYFIPHITMMTIPFLLIYGLSYFFTEFGPNTTTFVIPSEVFPTRWRAFGDGLSAGAGKMGAFLGALFVPILLSRFSLSGTEGIMAVVCLLGIGTTMLVPELKARSLSAIYHDTDKDQDHSQGKLKGRHAVS
ncbi:MFS transporter [Sulfoacidibacillus thermotolerans]|uniref:MFS transporter n=1 Tax=Sulfoacidibacillus thermotolerans TaxID=1765684 RepID=A0A2U3DBV3_SULT2|nr:MFS transporter [Sulfoacidibacillus thermotolerans]PWI58756.1 MFS transporter [Sulfoacidibacillus thermotolerans]